MKIELSEQQYDRIMELTSESETWGQTIVAIKDMFDVKFDPGDNEYGSIEGPEDKINWFILKT